MVGKITDGPFSAGGKLCLTHRQVGGHLVSQQVDSGFHGGGLLQVAQQQFIKVNKSES